MPEDAEYRSPFKVPPPQCNDKRFAIECPYSHAKYHNCPLHKSTTADKYANASLPVPDVSPQWTEWQRCREAFATADTDVERDLCYWGMLSCVSETNPPYADDLFKVPEQSKSRKDTLGVTGLPNTDLRVSYEAGRVVLLFVMVVMLVLALVFL